MSELDPLWLPLAYDGIMTAGVLVPRGDEGDLGVIYLDQGVTFSGNRLASVASLGIADGTAYTLVTAFETPAVWPGTDMAILRSGSSKVDIRIRNSDKRMVALTKTSANVTVSQMVSTTAFALSTKYLLGISYGASGNSMYIDDAAETLLTNVDAGGTINFNDTRYGIGGAAFANTLNLGGRMAPLWFKTTETDFSTDWALYHDGTGFLDAKNGAIIRMPWTDLFSDGSNPAEFEVLDAGSVTLGDW